MGKNLGAGMSRKREEGDDKREEEGGERQDGWNVQSELSSEKILDEGRVDGHLKIRE